MLPEMSDDEFNKLRARNRALGKIMHETRFGTVDGISFDLRHPELNPADWTMEPLGGPDGRRPDWRPLDVPFIWFPWFGTFDPKQLEKDVIKECEETNRLNANRSPLPEDAFAGRSCKRPKLKPLGRSWIKREIADRTPEIILREGDRVSISEIFRHEAKDEFLHHDDRVVMCVFIKVENDSGLNVKLKAPILMYGPTRFSYRHANKLIYSVIERVRRHYNIEKITMETARRITNNFEMTGYAFIALFRSIGICESILPRTWKLQDSEDENLWRIGLTYLEALDDACMLGYCWAKAEAEMKMKPLAVAALKSREGAKLAGKKSGEARRALADTTWKPHALELARSARIKCPELSQEKVADEIRRSWRLAIPIAAHSTLRGFIAEMEKAEKLSRPVKRGSANERGSAT